MQNMPARLQALDRYPKPHVRGYTGLPASPRRRAPVLPFLLATVFLSASLATPLPAPAQQEQLQAPMELLFHGHMGKARPGEKGTNELILGIDTKQYPFTLTRLEIPAGGLLPGDILSQIEPYKPNLLLYGHTDVLDKLAAAKPENQVVITGYRSLESRILVVTRVKVGEQVEK